MKNMEKGGNPMRKRKEINPKRERKKEKTERTQSVKRETN
jgi:hypothetical protein